MIMSNIPRKARWIDRKKFLKLSVGQKVKVRYMFYPGYIAGSPTSSESEDSEGNKIITDEIPMRFENGPWKDRPFKAIRQQIAHTL